MDINEFLKEYQEFRAAVIHTVVLGDRGSAEQIVAQLFAVWVEIGEQERQRNAEPRGL